MKHEHKMRPKTESTATKYMKTFYPYVLLKFQVKMRSCQGMLYGSIQILKEKEP